MKNQSGVTLLEVLMTITLLAILLSVAIRFVRPNVQFERVRDTERKSEIRAIQLAISQYQKDNNGNVPEGITTTDISICQPGCTQNSSQIDISQELDIYLENGIPIDPLEEGDIITGYQVRVSNQGRIIVSAPNAERETITTE